MLTLVCTRHDKGHFPTANSARSNVAHPNPPQSPILRPLLVGTYRNTNTNQPLDLWDVPCPA